jgi:hypothetical protein
LALVGLLCLYPVQAEEEPPTDDLNAPRPKASDQQGPLVREGTMLENQLGRFEMTGERVVFVLGNEGARFYALENLNLQRVAERISDSPETLIWSISGKVTEYRGGNYLFIHRAVLKNRSSEQITETTTP